MHGAAITHLGYKVRIRVINVGGTHVQVRSSSRSRRYLHGDSLCGDMVGNTRRCNGKAVKLDAAGNTKAADALKNSADRSANPDKKRPVTAKVTGSLSGNTIQVESIDVQ